MNKNAVLVYSGILLIGLIAFVYQRKSLEDSMQMSVQSWYGKEMQLSDSVKIKLEVQAQGDTLPTSDYILISYLDSTTCSSCRIRAFKKVILQMRRDTHMNIRSLLIVDSKSLGDINDALGQNHYDYPYVIDNEEFISKLNNFPHDDRIRTFLVDSTFHVVGIGNPMLNTKIYDLFTEIIKG